MSATAEARARPTQPRLPLAYAFYGLVAATLAAFLVWRIAIGDHPTHGVLHLIPWIVVTAAVGVIPVMFSREFSLAADFPITVAASLVLSPMETALVAFVGAVDIREVRRQIAPRKALFNRCQTALGTGLGSLAVHQLAAHPSGPTKILPLAFVSLLTNIALNYALVAISCRLEFGLHGRELLTVLPLLRPLAFLLSNAAWAVLGAMLASLYLDIHEVEMISMPRNNGFIDHVIRMKSGREISVSEEDLKLIEAAMRERE